MPTWVVIVQSVRFSFSLALLSLVATILGLYAGKSSSYLASTVGQQVQLAVIMFCALCTALAYIAVQVARCKRWWLCSTRRQLYIDIALALGWFASTSLTVHILVGVLTVENVGDKRKGWSMALVALIESVLLSAFSVTLATVNYRACRSCTFDAAVRGSAKC